MATEITLPNLGENITEGGIVDILVSVGDTVAADDSIVEVETDKATIEVPTNVAGTVTEIKVSTGDTVAIGAALIVVEASADGETPAPATEAKTPAPEPEKKTAATAEAPAKAAAAVAPAATPVAAPATASDPRKVAAAPSVRRLAYEIGVDITQVPGSGKNGRVTADDVKRYSKQLHLQGAGVVGGIPEKDLPDLSKFTASESVPMSKIRKVTAENMGHNWAVIPHVTQQDKADITTVEKFRQAKKKRVEQSGGKLTVTAILVKIVASALRTFPQFNASCDMKNGAVKLHESIHIGVAVDTEHGLLVPKIRDADTKSITQISIELVEISQKARDKKLGIDDMQGGTFTITNLGGIGGNAFTPIINWPEVAILGVARSAMEPVYEGGEFVPRLMMPLSLSYDHRVIDGADGARFLRFVCEAMDNPMLAMLEG